MTAGALVDHLRMGRGSANGQSEVVINEGSVDMDFRVESNGQANMLFVDGGNDTVSFTPNSGTLAVKAGRVDSTNNVRLEASGTTSTYLEYRGYLGHIFDVDTTERMRISTSGTVFYGCTALPDGSADGVSLASTQSQRRFSINATSNSNQILFYNGNGLVGTIGTNGSATAYATSSDYRLKENVTTSWDATTRLKQLKPSRFNFIADADTTVDGFLAHEVQSVVPEAISGTKDEVDADGNPVYQGIDQSKLVPLLVKTIQELEARIVALETA